MREGTWNHEYVDSEDESKSELHSWIDAWRQQSETHTTAKNLAFEPIEFSEADPTQACPTSKGQPSTNEIEEDAGTVSASLVFDTSDSVLLKASLSAALLKSGGDQPRSCYSPDYKIFSLSESRDRNPYEYTHLKHCSYELPRSGPRWDVPIRPDCHCVVVLERITNGTQGATWLVVDPKTDGVCVLKSSFLKVPAFCSRVC